MSRVKNKNLDTEIARFMNNFAMLSVINHINYHTASTVYHLGIYTIIWIFLCYS